MSKLDDYQREHRWLGFPIAVVYKFFDDQGTYLSALITYYGFLSLFPLLLLFTSVLGFVLQGNPNLRMQITSNAFQQFPGLADQVGGLNGSGVALAVGIIGSLYGGLGVAQAAQNAMNQVWAVPRNERPNPFKARLRSLGLLLLLGTGVVLVTAASGFAAAIGSLGLGLPGFSRVVSYLIAFGLNTGLFLLAYQLLAGPRLPWRALLPGALTAGLLWLGLQQAGAAYVQRVTGSSSAYGVFATVLGLLAWIFLQSNVVVLCAEINVVLRKRLWPRALLTPFTDNVELTPGDERAYAETTRAQRFKGFQKVEVEFEGQPAPPLGTEAESKTTATEGSSLVEADPTRP